MTYLIVTENRLTVVENVVTGLELLKQRGRTARLEREDGVLLAQHVPCSTWVPDDHGGSMWSPSVAGM